MEYFKAKSVFIIQDVLIAIVIIPQNRGVFVCKLTKPVDFGG